MHVNERLQCLLSAADTSSSPRQGVVSLRNWQDFLCDGYVELKIREVDELSLNDASQPQSAFRL